MIAIAIVIIIMARKYQEALCTSSIFSLSVCSSLSFVLFCFVCLFVLIQSDSDSDNSTYRLTMIIIIFITITITISITVLTPTGADIYQYRSETIDNTYPAVIDKDKDIVKVIVIVIVIVIMIVIMICVGDGYKHVIMYIIMYLVVWELNDRERERERESTYESINHYHHHYRYHYHYQIRSHKHAITALYSPQGDTYIVQILKPKSSISLSHHSDSGGDSEKLCDGVYIFHSDTHKVIQLDIYNNSNNDSDSDSDNAPGVMLFSFSPCGTYVTTLRKPRTGE